MAIPRVPKPQADGADEAAANARPANPGVRPFGTAGKAASGAAGKAVGKIPVVGKPLSTLGRLARGSSRLARRGGSAAAGAAQGAADATDDSSSALTRAGGGIARRGAQAGKHMTKRLAKGAGKVAKAAAKRAGKAALNGLKWLLSTPFGWAILAILAFLALIVGVLFAVSVQTFVSSFDLQQTDVATAGGGGGGAGASHTVSEVFVRTQVEHDTTTDNMETSARASGQPTENLAALSVSAHRARASQSFSYPAGEVIITVGSDSFEADGREVIAAVIPDRQRGLADLVEWMLPQWVSPYPLMVVEADNVEVGMGEWPPGSGIQAEIVSCPWPSFTWANPPPLGGQAPPDPDDVEIKGPWQTEGQHVCHLIAAAETIWQAWADTFGDHGFLGEAPGINAPANNGPESPLLDIAAARSLWVLDPPPGARNDFAAAIGSLTSTSDDPDRLWAWLTFAFALEDGGVPVSGQHDCAINHSDISFFWGRMGEFAKEGGRIQPADGLALPESFFAATSQGDLLVPWPCPRPVRAALEAGKRGLWESVVWAQNLGEFGPGGTKLVDGLPVTSETLAIMGGRGLDIDLALDHGLRPKAAFEEYQRQVAELPEIFDRDWLLQPELWDEHSRVPSERFEAWCQPDTRWVSETATEWIAPTEAEAQPKAGLVATFREDQEKIAEKHEEAKDLLSAAVAIRSAIAAELATVRQRLTQQAIEDSGVDPADGAAVSLVVQQVQPLIEAETARLRKELEHANEMVAALALVVEYWGHAKEQGELRPALLPGPTWQNECKHETFEDALGSLAKFQGDRLPDAASPLRALYTSGGRGRALSAYGDHWGGQQSPLENTLRVAQQAGLLPALPVDEDPIDGQTKEMVSAQCSLDRWLAKSCLMERSIQQGSEFLLMPQLWTDPRVGLKCPPVFAVMSELQDSALGRAAQQWEDAQQAHMVSVGTFTSFHPCLLPDMEAAFWLAEAVDLPIRGHGFRAWSDSDAWSAHPLVAPGGASRHNYGLAIDFEWQPPECWPPPSRFDVPCPSESQGSAGAWELCGRESRNGANGTYVDFTTPANVGDPKHNSTVDPIVMTNWCWRFLDWATYKLSGMGQRIPTGTGAGPDSQWRYPIVGLLPLSIEMWHWSYDGR